MPEHDIAAYKQRLNKARDQLNHALDLIGDRANEQIYSEGAQWTLRQLAIHLAVSSIGFNRMIRHYSEDKEVIPADYDLERYNRRSVEKRDEMTLAQARFSLDESRQELLVWFDQITDLAVFDKVGRHPFMKMLTVSEFIEELAIHEEGHAADIVAHCEQNSM